MKVKVVYFASARELASTPQETLTLPESASLKDLAERVVLLHPALKKLEGAAKFSVNLEVAPAGARLKDGDEVGVLPPVAGG